MMQPVSKFACPTSHHYGMRRQPMVAPTPRTRAAAAAAAKSLQSCPTLCDPIDSLPPGSPVWDSPGKNTGVCCHFLLQYMQVKSESEAVQSCPTLSDLMDCGLQDPPSMGFSRQEYWSGVPLPSLRTRAVNLIIRLQRDQYKDKASNPQLWLQVLHLPYNISYASPKLLGVFPIQVKVRDRKGIHIPQIASSQLKSWLQRGCLLHEATNVGIQAWQDPGEWILAYNDSNIDPLLRDQPTTIFPLHSKSWVSSNQ